jgi:hypothetical protein
MFRSRIALAVVTVFIATLIASPPANALTPTDNAWELKPEDVKKNGSVLCGRFISTSGVGSFKPGRWVAKAPAANRSALFIHYDTEAANYLAMSKKKKYSKSKRASYAKKAKASKALATGQASKCKNVNALKFSPVIATAKGVAIRGTANSNFSMHENKSSSSATKSNIFALNANGEMQQAIVNGYPEATMARVSPDGSLYIAFQNRINLLDVSWDPGVPGTANGCSLIRIPNGSSTPSCVDTLVYNLRTDFSDAIQFTSNGTMAYLAETDRGPIVRKRATNGTISNVTSAVGGVNIEKFRLLENGQVLAGGSTESNGLQWVKLYKTNGVNETLIPKYPFFIERFPDGKAYIGAESQNGVRVYNPVSQAMETTYYISGADVSEPNPPPATFYTTSMCTGVQTPGMCGDGGASARRFSTTTDQRVFALSGEEESSALIQYYPSASIQRIDISDVISRPTLMVAAGNKLVVAGVTSESKNVLYLVDPSTGQKTVLRSAATDFETYHIKYRASTNELLYDGLKSNNTFVLVKRNLSTNVESEQVVGSIRLLDLDVR